MNPKVNYVCVYYLQGVILLSHLQFGLSKPARALDDSHDLISTVIPELNDIPHTTEATSTVFSEEVLATTVPADAGVVETTVATSQPLTTTNDTAILVGILFALTMIVKGVPVVVSYTLRHCSKQPPSDGTEDVETVKQESTEAIKAVDPPNDLIKAIIVSSDENSDKMIEMKEAEVSFTDCIMCKQKDAVN